MRRLLDRFAFRHFNYLRRRMERLERQHFWLLRILFLRLADMDSWMGRVQDRLSFSEEVLEVVRERPESVALGHIETQLHGVERGLREFEARQGAGAQEILDAINQASADYIRAADLMEMGDTVGAAQYIRGAATRMWQLSGRLLDAG